MIDPIGKGTPMSIVRIGSISEFEDLEAGKLVEVAGQSIAVFNIAGKYYAIANTCPHRGGPLADGMMAGEEVICPWHGARFNVKTGVVTGPPAQEGVKSFPVRVNGSDLEVELDAESIAAGD
jgi:3-phenylpropionate/trans-cinnamate dioxygenase ferredoxin component